MSGRALIRAAALGGALLALGLIAGPARVHAVGEDPVAELTEALRGLGAPGLVWGRLVVDEESPLGSWTPLEGIEVALYPATPTLIGELDGIRQSARASAAQYESAVARVQAALAAHKGRVERLATPVVEPELVAEPPLLPSSGLPTAAGPGAPPAPADSGSGSGGLVKGVHIWRQKTDPTGLFAFDAVPSGDWVVVVIRVSPYGAEKARPEAKARQAAKAQRFMPRATGPAKEAEIWISRIRVVAGERVGLELTDRARWMVGPVR